MGVHGLWDLLAPVGRRVSVETLAGKRLAIDASIWMVQFMKAMRDEKGEMVRNAHLLGFFRRICKLLYLRTKPVFVFDGGTPALKRRTVIARRRQRENAQAKIRKTAEKLLLNHVKAMNLKKLAEDLKDQRAKNNSKGKKVMVDHCKALERNDVALEGQNQEMTDEMLVASVMEAERGGRDVSTSTSADGSELILPIGEGDVDPSVVAALPPSMQLDLLAKMRGRPMAGNRTNLQKMKKVGALNLEKLAEGLKDPIDSSSSKDKGVMFESDTTEGPSQEKFDEMLVASILAEECGAVDCGVETAAATDGNNHDASSSMAAFPTEDDEDESDEEMILPVSDGNVDPAVLAALPPSMQLDLLVQMRERLMAENRQKYQKAKKAPQKFSELQIEAYLKTVAFRREIDEVQRSAAGKGMAGMQTSRIASEANREFIFSSSFSGDKQLLTSGGAEKQPEKEQTIEKKGCSLNILSSVSSAHKSIPGARPTADEPVEDLVDDVQTFVDERGQMRVSRRRAMGIRMTRDLQRNIELMKEFEQQRTIGNDTTNSPIVLDGKGGSLRKSHCESQTFGNRDEFNGHTLPSNTENSWLDPGSCKDEALQKSGNCIKISFDDDGEKRSLDDDDDFFARLVSGKPCSADKSALGLAWEEAIIDKECGNFSNGNGLVGNSSPVQAKSNESDVEWNEVVIGEESGNSANEKCSCAEDGIGSDSDVEWVEGTTLTNDDNKLEIKSFHVEDSKECEIAVERVEGISELLRKASQVSADVPKAVSKGSAEEEAALEEAIRRSLQDVTDGKMNNMSQELEKSGDPWKRPLQESYSLVPSSEPGSALYDNEQPQSFVGHSNGSNVLCGKGAYASISHDIPSRSAAAVTALARAEPAPSPCAKEENAEVGNLAYNGSSVPTYIDNVTSSDLVDVALVDDTGKDKKAALAVGQLALIAQEQTSHADGKRTIGSSAEENIGLVGVQERGNDVEIFASKEEDNTIEFVGASLEDELLVLGQEYKNLGNEQRKLERNADSVTSEMFVECQELLQMFGLPYIIAPMEAEAQCAFMELMNLVDGVVTDDSDVFLFGARSVYKNIFDDRKYVETYFMKDIETELGLNRDKLIRMAMLLGSDYTEGVSGIGIVNAIEVVNAFPEEDGLYKFREWVESPDPAILGMAGSNSKKKGSKASKNGKSEPKSNTEGTSASDNALQENKDNQATDDSQNIKRIFMDKHRNVSKNWHIPASFPSDAVVSAYTAPQVDKSTESFAWGKPDIFTLRRFCWEKIGWASQKADELLLPVLKEYNKHETQLRLEAFYTFNEKFAKIRSKRINQAVKGITGKKHANDLGEVPDKPKKRKSNASSNNSKRAKSLTKRKNVKEGLSSEGGSTDMTTEAAQRGLSGAGSSKKRGGAVRKGGRKENSVSTDDETSCHNSDSTTEAYKHAVAAETNELPDTARRSKRARKAANYVEKDEENDEPTDSPNASNIERSHDEAAEHKVPPHPSVSGNDFVDLSRDERKSIFEDPSPMDASAEEYLLKGGGFYAGEDEPEAENTKENENSPSTDADREYLQMGGGFCVDENEEVRGSQERYNAVTEETGIVIDHNDSVVSPVNSSEMVESVVNSSISNFAGDQHEARATDNVNDNTRAPVSAFSAMPYLKRKRRKT